MPYILHQEKSLHVDGLVHLIHLANFLVRNIFPPLFRHKFEVVRIFHTELLNLENLPRSFKLRIHMTLLIHIALQNKNRYCCSFPSFSFSLEPCSLTLTLHGLLRHSVSCIPWWVLPTCQPLCPLALTDDPQQLNQLCDVGTTNPLELSSTTAQRAMDASSRLCTYLAPSFPPGLWPPATVPAIACPAPANSSLSLAWDLVVSMNVMLVIVLGCWSMARIVHRTEEMFCNGAHMYCPCEEGWHPHSCEQWAER